MTSELKKILQRHTTHQITLDRQICHIQYISSVSTGEKNLSRVLTDMINSTSTELSIELLGPKAPEVLDGEGPEVQHIVP